VASPYSVGDKQANVDRAVDYGNLLLDAGHAPFVPVLNHYMEKRKPRPWAEWMRLDMEWLPHAQVFTRLPGESAGGELEEAEAVRLGIPVVPPESLLPPGVAVPQPPEAP